MSGARKLVALNDHINFLPGTPMVGPNDERFGPRFFSMANAYDADLRKLLQSTAADKSITLHEGVYIAYPGPNFETPAEIRHRTILVFQPCKHFAGRCRATGISIGYTTHD